MLSRYLLVVLCAGLVACSGNNSSSVSIPDSSLKRFAGVINNSSVTGAIVSSMPVGGHGQLPSGGEDTISLSSDENGRYGILLDTDEESAFVVSVNAPNAPVISDTGEEVESSAEPAKMQCQVVDGCVVSGQSSPVAFGSFYSMPSKFRWSAAVEFISDGQFVVINPVTEMATLLGFSSYVNSPSDTGASIGSIAARGYYSSFGIVKSNSQTAALLGLTDILSIEPVNLFSLHNISVNNSTSLQDSIRYGALVAAWQKLEQAYNNSIAEGDFTFQNEVVFEYINNKGQLYQAAPLNDQKLSMKVWYQTAVDNLEAARDFHLGLSRSLPNELNLVIARFKQEIDGFQEGVLTTASPKTNQQINEQLNVDYTDAVAKTKAMVNYISDLKNNFADEEYRRSVQDASTLATDEVKKLAPKFDALMAQLLIIQQYYLSCTHGSCDASMPLNAVDKIYVAESKELTIIQSEDTQLKISQTKVFNEASPEGSDETFTHDLLITGALEFDGLRFELSDLLSGDTVVLNSSIRFVYATPLAEIPLLPELVAGGKGARVDESLVPNAIELSLASFQMFDKASRDTAAEITLSGAFSALMVANVSAEDFFEGVADEEKLGKRYNLSNVSATLRLVGAKQGELSTDVELRDNAVISFQAVASEAVASQSNVAAYFPDTVYPTLESFFNAREGFSVGSESPSTLVVSRRGVMDFPKLDSDGEGSETETVAVDYLELDYEIGGLERYVVYPKIGQDEEYFGLVCSATPADEEDLIGRSWTKVETDDEGNETTRALLTCNIRDKFKGESTPDSLINSVYAINKDLVTLREYNGQGVYRIGYDTVPAVPAETDADGNDVLVLAPFAQGEDTHKGVVEQSIVLGVDSMRLQVKPEFVNDAATGYLPDTAFDVSLVWRRHDLIDVNVFLSFNADENYNNPNGSGLPYLGIGSDVESYSVAYRTDEAGNELGEFVFAWSGVQFVDGPIGADGKPIKVMQRTSDESLKEGFIAGIGSNVEYRDYTQRERDTLNIDEDNTVTKEKCGFFNRGELTEEGENCAAIAYLTFRGLVTGVLREERDGAYVIRYIDDTWQVLGVK